VYPELKDHGFDLARAVNHGLLPSLYLNDEPTEDLSAYVGQYLTEEIAAEGVVRNIPQFNRFLEVAATANAQLINYSSVASDSGLSRQTVQGYFNILYDTLLGFELPSFTQTSIRKPINTAKFYFFDLGITKTLRQIDYISEGSKDFGDAFEHFIFLELKAYIDYKHHVKKPKLNYWRTTSGFEVDFILADKYAIECKSAKRLSQSDFAGLFALRDEGKNFNSIIVCLEFTKRLDNNVLIYPWKEFLDDLWSGKII
jgi:predicted AAA+ superfamily ATPase